jgi:DNA-binding response OmpR family regulator
MILVKDDCADIRTMMADVLAEEGYAVRCVNRLTPETVRREQADLVIVDLSVGNPDTTLLLLGQLRRDKATHNLPILISCTDPRLLDELAGPLRHLNCATLLKPFDIEQLLAYVAEAHNVSAH